MTSKLLWLENIRKDLSDKPMKSDTLKIRQSFKSEVTFPCFGIGIVSVCSTVCLLLLLFLFEIQLVSPVCDDSHSHKLLQDWEQVSTPAACKVSPKLCAGWSL